MALRWIANSFKDPTEKLFDETWERAIDRHKQWLSDKVIGDPKPITENQTVESLKAMGLFGVYKDVTET